MREKEGTNGAKRETLKSERDRERERKKDRERKCM